VSQTVLASAPRRRVSPRCLSKTNDSGGPKPRRRVSWAKPATHSDDRVLATVTTSSRKALKLLRAGQRGATGHRHRRRRQPAGAADRDAEGWRVTADAWSPTHDRPYRTRNTPQISAANAPHPMSIKLPPIPWPVKRPTESASRNAPDSASAASGAPLDTCHSHAAPPTNVTSADNVIRMKITRPLV
jgi:hypothetical protein